MARKPPKARGVFKVVAADGRYFVVRVTEDNEGKPRCWYALESFFTRPEAIRSAHRYRNVRTDDDPDSLANVDDLPEASTVPDWIEQDDRLKALWAGELTLTSISKVLGRTVEEVMARAAAMSLPERPQVHR